MYLHSLITTLESFFIQEIFHIIDKIMVNEYFLMGLNSINDDHVFFAVKVNKVAAQVLGQQEDVTVDARHDCPEPSK